MLSRLDFLSAKAAPLIGLDISTAAVKMLELSQAGPDAYTVERYWIEPLPQDAVVEGNIANLEETGEVVKRAWQHMGSRIRNVAMALPAAAVITKKVIIPTLERDEDIEAQVETEANQYIPFTLDEVNLDFQVIGPAPSGAEEMEVLIAAARKERVEDRVAVAQAAGLKPTVMDVESYALLAAMALVEKQLPEVTEQIIAVVDIGAAVMRITVQHKGQAVYMREQQVGGNQLSQEIMRQFSVTLEEAESNKKSGNLPDSYQADVLNPFVEKLALEVARALQFFFTSTPFSKVDQIALAGGCATLDGLQEAIAHRTHVNSFVANPFAKMTVSSRIKASQLVLDAPSLLVACGLALRRFE